MKRTRKLFAFLRLEREKLALDTPLHYYIEAIACAGSRSINVPDSVNCGRCPPGYYGTGYTSCVDDLCPTDPNKTTPGVCGCGVPDTNSDGDGVSDCVDQTGAGLGSVGGYAKHPISTDGKHSAMCSPAT